MASDESLRSVLLSVTAITDEVGATGVYLDDAGQSDLSSYIIISQQGFNPHNNLDGSAGVSETEFDIDCYAKTRTAARVIADAVSTGLKNYSGTVTGTTFKGVNYLDEGSDVVTSGDGSTVNYYVLTQTYNIFWS